jgi:pimeloyl-ACP methyl ester carboxylesterase
VPLLTIFATKDQAAPPEAGRHYRERLANCNVVFVYDAGAAMAEERPEAVAELAIDFLHRGDTFLVRQTSDLLYR